jgi:Heterokaryon incompatibility protein (HET)
VDGHPFQVTISLESVLAHFRRPSRARVIWADAICINQSDDVEKTSQVNLMHDIYQSAEQCLVWLGDYRSEGFSDFGADYAFSIIRWLAIGKHLMRSFSQMNTWKWNTLTEGSTPGKQ